MWSQTPHLPSNPLMFFEGQRPLSMPQTLLDSPSVVARTAPTTRATILSLLAMTPAVLVVHGYHPFSDDAGIYVAGIRKLLNPALYKPDAPFVMANTHLSIFSHLLAGVVLVTHLPLSVVLLMTHLASIFLFLLGSWCVAVHLFRGQAERWFAVGFAAACFTLPAAGTALVLMDPYVTSRSFSTPLGLFAVAAVLERRWARAAIFVVLAGLMHPLMVLYAAALVVFYALLDSERSIGAVAFALGGLASAGLVAFAARHQVVSPAYFATFHTPARAFLFPARWKWYEDFGLVAPLALFAVATYRARFGSRIQKLCLACIALGVSSMAAAFLFVHSDGPYLLLRLQILRSFHVIYLIGVLLMGGWIGKQLGSRRSTRWIAFTLLTAAATGLFASQRAAYPFSAHIEWPGEHPRNPWAQAYWWIRANTPRDAVFAADPDLVGHDGVDMQGFRATTERSLLADNKDQGVAAVMKPAIADKWFVQRDAQLGLEDMSDQQRITKLSSFGVNWLLLRSDSATDFPCPYRNAAAKVCRMEELRAARPPASAPPLR